MQYNDNFIEYEDKYIDLTNVCSYGFGRARKEIDFLDENLAILHTWKFESEMEYRQVFSKILSGQQGNLNTIE